MILNKASRIVLGLVFLAIFGSIVFYAGAYYYKYKSKKANERALEQQETACVCGGTSANVKLSVKLVADIQHSWGKGSYHYISFFKTCSAKIIRLQFEDRKHHIINSVECKPCETGFLYKIPELQDTILNIKIGVYAGSDSAFDNIQVRVTNVEQSEYVWKKLNSNAAYYKRDGVMGAKLNNRYVMVGGWNPATKYYTNNEIWYSMDAINWKFQSFAPWERRHFTGSAFFRNKYWIIGGDVNQGRYQNDIWTTNDGTKWDKVTDSIQWPVRVHFGVRVFGNKLWLMGGERVNKTIAEKPELFNDVWCSEDGKSWKQVTEHAAWSPRAFMGAYTEQGTVLSIYGGSSYTGTITAKDTWTSSNGKDWVSTKTEAPWLNKAYSSYAFFDKKLWMIAGSDSSRHNTNEVWYTPQDGNWYKLNDVPFKPTHANTVIADRFRMIIACGITSNEIWQLTRK